MILRVKVNNISLNIKLPRVKKTAYNEASSILDNSLKQGEKNRDAIAESFLCLLHTCPNENASDMWHHIVYRQYLKILPTYRSQDPSQSWKRASGEALELVLQKWYTPIFEPHQISIVALFSSKRRKSALKTMRIAKEVGSGKLDIGLYANRGKNKHILFGGVHVKGSLAERVSDDVPASRAMMKKGFFSPLWTLDVKSFPPPQGNLINRGELGTKTKPSEKRRYIEHHGDFDNCYSANSRTNPSVGITPSGKHIYTLIMSKQPDQFAKDVIDRVKRL